MTGLSRPYFNLSSIFLISSIAASTALSLEHVQQLALRLLLHPSRKRRDST